MTVFHVDFHSIPLSQMLDINDIIWYCSEVRHQIEKKRYQTTPNHYPLLKYVRSNAFPVRPNQPATTTTTSSSAYSMSNILSTVNELFLICGRDRINWIFSLDKIVIYNTYTFTTIYIQCSTTIRNRMYRNDWKVWLNILISCEKFVSLILLVKRFNVF